MPELEVSAADLATVLEILHRHIPQRTVLAFGSRVTHTAKPFSDLDLAVLGDEPLTSRLLGSLHDDFDESDLPFKVDIVDWTDASPGFRKAIERGVIIQEPVSATS